MSSQTDMQALIAKIYRLEVESEVDASKIKMLEQEIRTLQVEKRQSTIKPDVQAPVLTGSSDTHLRAEILRLENQNAAKDATIACLHEYVASMKTHLGSMIAMIRAVESKFDGKVNPEEHYLRKELTCRVSVTHTDKSGEPSSTSPPRLFRGGSQTGRDMSTTLFPMTDLLECTAPETHKPSPSLTSMNSDSRERPSPRATPSFSNTIVRSSEIQRSIFIRQISNEWAF